MHCQVSLMTFFIQCRASHQAQCLLRPLQAFWHKLFAVAMVSKGISSLMKFGPRAQNLPLYEHNIFAWVKQKPWCLNAYIPLCIIWKWSRSQSFPRWVKFLLSSVVLHSLNKECGSLKSCGCIRTCIMQVTHNDLSDC